MEKFLEINFAYNSGRPGYSCIYAIGDTSGVRNLGETRDGMHGGLLQLIHEKNPEEIHICSEVQLAARLRGNTAIAQDQLQGIASKLQESGDSVPTIVVRRFGSR